MDELVQPLFEAESTALWGGLDWRKTHLLQPDVILLLRENIKLMESVHKFWTQRSDRPQIAKQIDFLLEDSFRMFKLLPRVFNSYHLKAAFSASKQNLV